MSSACYYCGCDDNHNDLQATVSRLTEGLEAIVRGSTAVLISAALDECPINPEVLEQIVKDATAALGTPPLLAKLPGGPDGRS